VAQQQETRRYARLINSLKSWPWVLLALASSGAHAEIFSCHGDRAVTVYQNFPCAFNSLGSVPTGFSTPVAPAATAHTNLQTGRATASGNSARERGVAAPAATATAAANVPHVGSSADEVRTTWGEPEEVVQDEPPKGRIEIWRYKDGRSVEIDRRHRVIAVRL
jgi:hypothetical protein